MFLSGMWGLRSEECGGSKIVASGWSFSRSYKMLDRGSVSRHKLSAPNAKPTRISILEAKMKPRTVTDEMLREMLRGGMALSLPGQNLDGADLERASLRNADFEGASLRGANLKRADLSHANLSWSNLEGSDLTGACLIASHLPHAKLNGARLSHASLARADLRWSRLREVDLTDADLVGALLDGADLWKAETHGVRLTRSSFDAVQNHLTREQARHLILYDPPEIQMPGQRSTPGS
jgi:hypothetical protein